MSNNPATDMAVLDSSGALDVRLARSQAEIEAAQRLRFQIFYREMSAQATPEMERSGRDFDDYDPICKHLLVINRDTNEVVATYRLMREDVAARSPKGFYTAGEYDIAALLKARAGQRLLELGRSCVLKDYRTGPTMQLLWRGLLVYLIKNEISMMFGCGSLPGTDPQALALPLSYLHHFHATPESERVRALPARYVSMNLMPKEAIDEAEALRSLPPLIKGYIRSGAKIGDGAVIDHQFGTTDVFIHFPLSYVHPRWITHLRKKTAAEHSG